jgi:hypothetical protein
MRGGKIKNIEKEDKKNMLPGAIAIAFLAAIIVYIVMLNVEKSALMAYEKGNVLLAEKEILPGVIITGQNVGQYFTLTQADIKLIPETAVFEEEFLIGSQAIHKVDQGSIITASMFSEETASLATIKKPVIAGFKADDLFQVASGILRSGDRIHVYMVDEEYDAAYLVWENVLVQEVFDSAGNRILPEDQEMAASRVNVFMEQDSIERFYSELATGSLRAVKIWDREK